MDKKLEEVFEDTSGTRTMTLSRHLGLLDKDNNKPTKVYDEILKRTKNFKSLDKYIDIIGTQLEKLCYWNRNNLPTDTRNPEAKLFNKKFKNFLILTLYKVILIIGDKTKNYEITYDEYRLFIFISRNYKEYKDIADHIISLRNENKKPLIIRYLNDQVKVSPTKLDDRFYQLFPYLTSLIYDKEEGYIRIKDKYLDRIKSLIKKFVINLRRVKCLSHLKMVREESMRKCCTIQNLLGIKLKKINKNIKASLHSKHYLLHRYWGRKAHNVVNEYIKNYTKKNDLVLDPFMGSGVVPIECSKIQRKAIGVDLNPISTFIVNNTINKIDLNLLEKNFNKIFNKNKKKYENFYFSKCKKCNSNAIIENSVWKEKVFYSIKIRCKKCGILIKKADALDRKLLDKISSILIKKKIIFTIQKKKYLNT